VCAGLCRGGRLRPPSERSSDAQHDESVSGERQRILLLVRTARSLPRPCCEVRPLRAQAQSVTERSLTKAVRKTRGHSAPTEIQSVVKFTATSRRAYQHRPGFEPSTVIPVPWLRPQLQRGCPRPRCTQGRESTRISLHVHLRAVASPWKSGPLRAALSGTS
jgi:hypothetical protein